MTRHRRTRVRNYCTCQKCRPTVIHGTQESARACGCGYCRAAQHTYARLRAYHRAQVEEAEAA